MFVKQCHPCANLFLCWWKKFCGGAEDTAMNFKLPEEEMLMFIRLIGVFWRDFIQIYQNSVFDFIFIIVFIHNYFHHKFRNFSVGVLNWPTFYYSWKKFQEWLTSHYMNHTIVSVKVVLQAFVNSEYNMLTGVDLDFCKYFATYFSGNIL